jgi:hypothetical protein
VPLRTARTCEPPRRVWRLQSLRRMESCQDVTGSTAGVAGTGGAAGRRVPPGSRVGVGGDAFGRAEAGDRHHEQVFYGQHPTQQAVGVSTP